MKNTIKLFYPYSFYILNVFYEKATYTYRNYYYRI